MPYILDFCPFEILAIKGVGVFREKKEIPLINGPTVNRNLKSKPSVDISNKEGIINEALCIM